TASPLSASCPSDSTTGAARRTNARVCVAARPLTSRKTEPVSASVLALALRSASQSTTVPVNRTSPHTPSTSLARKLRPRVAGAAGGEAAAAAAAEGVIVSAYAIVDPPGPGPGTAPPRDRGTRPAGAAGPTRTHPELADHLYSTQGIRTSRPDSFTGGI